MTNNERFNALLNSCQNPRAVLDLILWAKPDKLQTIWSFVRSYLSDEIIGIHADADYLIEHGKFLQAERRRGLHQEGVKS